MSNKIKVAIFLCKEVKTCIWMAEVWQLSLIRKLSSDYYNFEVDSQSELNGHIEVATKKETSFLFYFKSWIKQKKGVLLNQWNRLSCTGSLKMNDVDQWNKEWLRESERAIVDSIALSLKSNTPLLWFHGTIGVMCYISIEVIPIHNEFTNSYKNVLV